MRGVLSKDSHTFIFGIEVIIVLKKLIKTIEREYNKGYKLE